MTCSFIRPVLQAVPSFTLTRSPVTAAPAISRLPYLIRFRHNYDIMSKGKAFVDAKLEGSKVVVFSKSYCPYCTMAKKALGKYKINSLDIIEIEDRDDCQEIQAYMQKLTGGTSVPRVFINKKFIGGGSETTQYDREGKLEVMLKDAGAL